MNPHGMDCQCPEHKIERLLSENAVMRKALEWIAATEDVVFTDDAALNNGTICALVNKARAALKKIKEGKIQST